MSHGVQNAILLVGGKGTRMHPLTKDTPKPMLEFVGMPIVEHTMAILSRHQVANIFLCVNYFSDQIEANIQKWEKKYNIHITSVREKTELDTAGPINLVSQKFPQILNEEGVLVINSDLFTEINISEFIGVYFKQRENHNSVCTIATTVVDDPRNFGCLKVEMSSGKIQQFLEKPKTQEEIISNTINAGIYCVSPDFIRLIRPGKVSIEKDIFPQVAKSGKLFSYFIDCAWFDIGTPSSYLKAQQYFLNKHGKDERENSRNVFIGKNVKIADNVVLKNCTLMSGVQIESNCKLTNVIIGKNCIISQNTVIGGDKQGISVIESNMVIASNSTLLGKIELSYDK